MLLLVLYTTAVASNVADTAAATATNLADTADAPAAILNAPLFPFSGGGRSSGRQACRRAGPTPAEQAAASAASASAAAAAAMAAPAAAAVGGYMRAAGMLKLREEADSFSLELGTVSAAELVKVEQVYAAKGCAECRVRYTAWTRQTKSTLLLIVSASLRILL